jgi:hypothetical protein
MSLLVQLVKTSNDSLISPFRYAKEPIVAILYVIDKKSSIVKLIDIGVCFARCAVWSFGAILGTSIFSILWRELYQLPFA